MKVDIRRVAQLSCKCDFQNKGTEQTQNRYCVLGSYSHVNKHRYNFTKTETTQINLIILYFYLFGAQRGTF